VPTDGNAVSEREQRIDDVLGAYLQAVADGDAPDRDDLLARHPDLSGELHEFFQNQDDINRWTAPLRPVAQAALMRAIADDVTPLSAADTLFLEPGQKGRRFGAYELLEEIGRGGVGVVYKAWQTGLGRLVALKRIAAGSLASEAELRRFRNEAEAAAQLDHANILPIYEVGDLDGLPYFTMKLADGGSLGRAVSSGQWAVGGKEANRNAARLLAAVARGVHHAHQHGVLHRDLKPSNILVDGDRQPYVADFGLAKRLSGDSDVTQSGALIGTPSYMAPEQAAARPGPSPIAQGEGKGSPVTTATDVYGLGAVLYTLLTGQPPFKGETILDTLVQVRNCEPVPPGRLKAGLDRDLEAVCLKCLEKEPQRRYLSAAALAEDLERWLAGKPVTAAPTRPLTRAWRWCARNPVIAGLSAAVAVFLVVALVVLSVSLVVIAAKERETAHQRDEARAQRRRARETVDTMYTQVAEKWLGTQPGMEKLLREFLTAALRFYTEFTHEESSEPEDQFQTALAYQRVGRIQELVFRQHSKAERALLKSIGILDNLSKEYPEQPAYANELALSYMLLAWTKSASPQEEELWMRRAVKVCDRLVITYPAATEYRSRLAQVLHNLYDPIGHQRRNSDAEAVCHRVIAFIEDAPKGMGRTPLDTIRLSQAYSNLGRTLTDAGRFPEAVKHFRKSIELVRPLAGLNPDMPEYKHGMSSWDWMNFGNHHSLLGDVLRRIGEYSEGRRFIQRGIRIGEHLVESFPEARFYADQLCGSYVALGRLEQACGNRQAATKAYQAALHIGEQLSRRGPTLRSLLSLLLTCPDVKLREPRRATRIAEKMVVVRPKDPWAWKSLALAKYRTANYKQALAAARRSSQFAGPQDVSAGFIQAMCHWKLGNKTKAVEIYQEAAKWLEKGHLGDEDLCVENDEARALLGIGRR
jgi:serine/threonine protein kinase/tetratricopeptide (TPR) repeat protein